ncbi:MAG: undecaprenyl-diphosphate phosphatase [Bacteroidales bacterium]|nr:undecaprenyl-diphosphate phosphatase [Bacteroidales bacterium]
MQALEGIILGAIQGLTEFLPVSSSGHLVIARELLGIEASEDLTMEVALHTATVLSTIVVFRKEILSLLKGFFKFRYNDETDYLFKIALSMVPVFVVGVFFKDAVEALFGSLLSVGIALMITAVLLFLSDQMGRRGGLGLSGDAPEPRNGISWWQAFVTGLGQAFAVAPGLSRSGTTIATGIISGVRREKMAQFSFLMVLPPILGEALLEVAGGDFAQSSAGALPLLLGFVSAFLTGLLACKAMVALVRRSRLGWFALYCALLSVAVTVSAVLA